MSLVKLFLKKKTRRFTFSHRHTPSDMAIRERRLVSGFGKAVHGMFLGVVVNSGRSCRPPTPRHSKPTTSGLKTCAALHVYDTRMVDVSPSESRKFYFDTHAMVRLLESQGFSTEQSEVLVSALVKITGSNMEALYKDMVTKTQQEIALQQVMSHIAALKKDMIILEKSEFSALRNENEKMMIELQQLKKLLADEITRVRTDTKLDINLEKSRTQEMFSFQEKRTLETRTDIVEMHAQEERAITNTNNRIETEIAGLKTLMESHKLDVIKYLAGSVFTCLGIALGFYRLWS